MRKTGTSMQLSRRRTCRMRVHLMKRPGRKGTAPLAMRMGSSKVRSSKLKVTLPDLTPRGNDDGL